MAEEGATGPACAAAPEPHPHDFLGADHGRHERRTRAVVAVSLVAMAAELWGGRAFGSVALTADGLHMSTHAAALLAAAAAYAYARRRGRDPRFSFGAGKVGDLAAFGSGVGLLVMAALIAAESVGRLLRPEPIAFAQGAAVAALGLAVSLASAVLLHHGTADGHAHGHAHGRDHNVWAAYLHMVADVLTSALTILALGVGARTGWTWLDPLVGLVGAALVASFAVQLMRRAGGALLDLQADPALAAEVRRRLEADGGRVVDLHLWRLGPGHLALLAQLVAAEPLAPSAYRARLSDLPGLSHVTIEVEPAAPSAPDLPTAGPSARLAP